MHATSFSTLALLTILAGGCAAVTDSAVFADEDRDPDQGGSSGGQGGSPGGGEDPDLGLSSSGAGPDGSGCPGDHTAVDEDADGWTGGDGDCNDCDALVNPGALDFPDTGGDEDCSGADDDAPLGCDDGLALASTDALDGARALGICQVSAGGGWGILEASYVTASGSPLPNPRGHGLLDGFGAQVKPREGSRLLALSSGAARQPGEPGYEAPSGYDKGYVTAAPPGFPKESPACPGVVSGPAHDSAALRLVLKTPTNAKSFHFDFDFYTYEYPEFICSKYNDFFVALLAPAPDEHPDGNVSFDAQGNTISVNAGFLEVCQPQVAGGKQFPCSLGPAALLATGFEGHGATGWLQTSAPLPEPGATITLSLAVWDSGDGVLDSTVLLDAFAFDPEETTTVTEPIDVPK